MCVKYILDTSFLHELSESLLRHYLPGFAYLVAKPSFQGEKNRRRLLTRQELNVLDNLLP